MDKKVGIKNLACCYFDDIIQIKDSDCNNFWLNQKLFENLFIYDVSYKLWLMQNHCILYSVSWMCLLKTGGTR